MVPVLMPGEQLYSMTTGCGPLPVAFTSTGLDVAQLPAAGAWPAAGPWAASALPPHKAMPSAQARIELERIVVFMFT
jgi:hypothetical protein